MGDMKHCGTKRIETERLILRPFELGDIKDMLDYWISYPNVQYEYAQERQIAFCEVFLWMKLQKLNIVLVSFFRNGYANEALDALISHTFQKNDFII